MASLEDFRSMESPIMLSVKINPRSFCLIHGAKGFIVKSERFTFLAGLSTTFLSIIKVSISSSFSYASNEQSWPNSDSFSSKIFNKGNSILGKQKDRLKEWPSEYKHTYWSSWGDRWSRADSVLGKEWYRWFPRVSDWFDPSGLKSDTRMLCSHGDTILLPHSLSGADGKDRYCIIFLIWSRFCFQRPRQYTIQWSHHSFCWWNRECRD